MNRTIKFLSLFAGLIVACGNTFAQSVGERIVNGDLEGSDFSSFALYNSLDIRDLTAEDVVVDTEDTNNHCIKIVSKDNPSEAWDTEFAENIIWQEDWSSWADKAKTVLDGVNSNYSFTGTKKNEDGSFKSGTTIYAEALAGGEAPELLIAKNGGSFTAKIALNGKSGEMTLTFKSNKALTVTATDATLGEGTNQGNDYTYPVSVAAGKEYITITFTMATNANARFDNVKLFQGEGKKAAGLSWGTSTRTVTLNANDNVLFIKMGEPLNEGDIITFSMRIRASQPVRISSLANVEPGKYKHYEMIGNPYINTFWETYTFVGTIKEEQSGCKTIALVLNGENKSIEYYFDDISVKVWKKDSLIDFADPAVKALCVANWDTDGDGELSYAEAVSVTNLRGVFSNNQEITSFNELQYFIGLRWISDNEFYNCKALTTLKIPNNVTTIASSAFYLCSNLTSITIPNSVTSIGGMAFSNCRCLSNVTIPNSVTEIDFDAFSWCTGLTSIAIPNSVMSIDYTVFIGCSGLTSITVDSNNPNYDSRNGCNAIIEKSTNTLITGCKNTVIPNTVTTIGSYAFSGCSGLTSVTIGSGVTTIGNYAFYNCSGLTLITIPNSVGIIGDHAFSYCYSLTSIAIPNSVTSIGANAFYGCSGLTEIICLPTTPTDINPFSGITLTDALLYVPVGCKEVYKQHSEWGKFKTILELNLSNIDEQEWTALQNFYQSSGNGDGWIKKWDFSTVEHSASTLPGVMTHDGHVTQLNLSANGLHGPFPTDVLALPYLEELNLSGNSLTGDIGQTMNTYVQEHPSAAISLKSVDISNNQLSGNIGLFAVNCPNLQTLKASGNSLEEVNPMISQSVTDLDLSNQTISRVIDLDLATLSAENIISKIPNILLYDHQNQTFTTSLKLKCTTTDNSWWMTIACQDGQLSIPYVSTSNAYKGASGDLLSAAVLKNNGTPEGSTFQFRLSFEEGDGNFDGQIDILDLQTDINYIMEKYLNKPYNFTASDLWKDDIINVQDIIRLVSLLMNSNPNMAFAASPRRNASDVDETTDAYVYVQDGQLIVESNKPIAAFDIVIGGANGSQFSTQNTPLTQIGMTIRTQNVPGGIRIIGYSMNGICVPTGLSTIGTFTTNAAAVRNVMLADSEAYAIKASCNGSATGIENVHAPEQDDAVIYDMQGRRVQSPSQKGLYIINGHKVVK